MSYAQIINMLDIQEDINTKNKIHISDPVCYKLNNEYTMLCVNITTSTTPQNAIDLTKKATNETFLISSNNIYNEFKNTVITRSNKNIGPVKFFSFAGGQEVTRLITDVTQMSKLPYPVFSGTLLSSITLPLNMDNNTVYLTIDKRWYNVINTIVDSEMKTTLIEKDLELLLNEIKINIEGKNVNFIISFEKELYDELVQYKPDIYTYINSFGIKIIITDKRNLVLYMCDLVFGIIVGGQNHQYTGIINPVNFKIIDAFITGKKNHTIIKRTSGLAISGNGTSTIYMLLCNNIILNEIRLIDVTMNTELLNINTSTCEVQHTNNELLLVFIKLIEYCIEIKRLLERNIKKDFAFFMEKNIKKNHYWEIVFWDFYKSQVIEEDVKSYIDCYINVYYVKLINQLSSIRMMFSHNKIDDNNNLIMQREPIMQRESTIGINDTFELPPPVLERQPPVLERQAPILERQTNADQSPFNFRKYVGLTDTW